MANSATDARQSEIEIRKKILRAHAVEVMIAIGPNFFYTVTLLCTLWFFDKGKAKMDRKDKVLFIDARHIFRQIDWAHRNFTPLSNRHSSIGARSDSTHSKRISRMGTRRRRSRS